MDGKLASPIVLRLPFFLVLILDFIKSALEKCGGMSPVRPLAERGILRFKAAAKAEGEDVALGGWLCHPQGVKHSRWFAVRITRANAPWAYWAGDATRAIASLELFASLLCVMVFATNKGDARGI